MPKIIKHGELLENTWSVLAKDELPNPAATHILIHASAIDKFEATDVSTVGIWLDSSDSIQLLPSNVQEFALIAVNFPIFADGRGFSLGRQIREQLDYTGELRAIGNFMLDQAFYLKRCGFNSFAVADDVNVDFYKVVLNSFQNTYQAAVDEPRPLFRRRG